MVISVLCEVYHAFFCFIYFQDAVIENEYKHMTEYGVFYLRIQVNKQCKGILYVDLKIKFCVASKIFNKNNFI